uniref:RRM domain-containing protein n=1 Tax=Glossina brevipalpis TaxID=37001 RepID=A0A1A9X393_9MUSC
MSPPMMTVLHFIRPMIVVDYRGNRHVFSENSMDYRVHSNEDFKLLIFTIFEAKFVQKIFALILLNHISMATATKASKNICKLFVGNLPWTVGHQELKSYFKEFGRVINASVIFNKKTGLSRGYGFVTFNNLGPLEKIENEQKHILEGNYLNIQKT